MARATHLPTTTAGWGLLILALIVAALVLTVIPALTAAWRLGGRLSDTAGGHDTPLSSSAKKDI